MAYGNPTQSQINNTIPVANGALKIDRGLSGNIFASGILSPEHSNFLSVRFPQYVGTSMLEQLGSYSGIAQNVWSWSEMARTRKSAVISSGVSGLPTASLTLTTDVAAAAAGDGYFLVGDTIRTESGVTLRITAVGASGGFQTITVVRQDGANIATGNIANSESVGHVASAFGEYSSAPGARKFLPNERYGKLSILRRDCTISGSALTAKTYLEDGSWYYENEMIVMDEFARDRENAIMFGAESADGATVQTGAGIVPMVLSGGVTNTFGGGVTENNIQDHITDLIISSPAKEYTVLAGAQFLTDVSQALRDYYVSGGVQFGTFGPSSKVVGINVETYKFRNVTVNFVHYPTFDDTATLPFAATATASKINYSNFSLWLNMGTEVGGKKLISLKYAELDGQQRKFIYKYEPGMMSIDPSYKYASNGVDGLTGHMLSDIGIELRCLNQHGALYANS